jgi:hypothetical protein
MKSFSNFYIVYLNEHEYEVEDCLLLLEKYSKEMGLDTSRFYMVNNNSKLEYYKEKYNLPFKVHSLDFLLQINSRNLSQLNPNLILDKEGFFMSHNRSVKPHRYCLLIILKKIGLLDDIDWSLIMGTDRKNTIAENKKDNEFYKNIFTEDEIDEYQEYIDYFEQIDIKKSKYEIEHSWFDDINNHHGIDWSRVFELKTYENSFINITTESCYFLNEVHITDKTIKPLYFYQMPLFLASYNHVKTVKERYGFDVFDDLINHSYDNEPDNRKRFFMVIDEIIRLNNMKEKVKEFYKKNQSRLFKNRIIASQLKKSKKDSNFFLKLIN